MLIGLELRLSVLCPSCNARTPLVGLRRQPTCHRCLQSISLTELKVRGDPANKYYFGGWFDVVQEAIALLDEDQAGSQSGKEEEYRLEYRRTRPRCLACGSAFGEEMLRSASGQLVCACGVSTPIRGPDAGVRELDERILCVVGDAGDSPEPPRRLGQALVLKCMSCGAALPVDGSGRTVTCSYCSSANTLPDDVWLRLHPAPAEQPFFLVIDVDPLVDVMARVSLCYTAEGRERTADLTAEICLEPGEPKLFPREGLPSAKAALAERLRALLLPENRRHLVALLRGETRYQKVATRALLALPQTAPLAAEIWGLAGDSLQALASEPQASPGLLLLVARGGDPGTRERLAHHPALPAEAASVLAGDGEATVRAAVAERADLGPSLLAQLAADPLPVVRAAAAGNSAMTAELLKQLRRDAAPEVQAAARQNASYQPGFFGRLLGR